MQQQRESADVAGAPPQLRPFYLTHSPAPHHRPSRPLQGYSSWTIAGTRFDLPDYYRLIRAIGTGAYGVVVSAEDTRTGAKVAMKKIPNAFNDLTDALRVLREIRLMRHFKQENLVSLHDLVPPPALTRFEDVYIASELMESDLHRIVSSQLWFVLV